MSDERLTERLAECVMGWGVGPDRFMTGNRSWMPRWRFQPAEKLADALCLLEMAAPEEYSLRGDSDGNSQVDVRIGDANGEARCASQPRAITCAIARAVGLDVSENLNPVLVNNDGVVRASRSRPNGK